MARAARATFDVAQSRIYRDSVIAWVIYCYTCMSRAIEYKGRDGSECNNASSAKRQCRRARVYGASTCIDGVAHRSQYVYVCAYLYMSAGTM